jgi:putative phosphoribosyl transferase
MARLIELPELRDQRLVFGDRLEAGRVLATLLEKYRKGAAVVLGIPAGGVPVGLEVAAALELPFDVVISRKLPIPGEPEAGFGAVSAEGDLFLNEVMMPYWGIDPEQARALAGVVQEEVRRRERLFRGQRPFPELSGKAAIIVDDGLATGYTAMACLAQVSRKGPSKLVMAVPTASVSSIERVGAAADEIYCANVRGGRFFAVAEAYRQWRDLGEEEVLALLAKHFPPPAPANTEA